MASHGIQRLHNFHFERAWRVAWIASALITTILAYAANAGGNEATPTTAERLVEEASQARNGGNTARYFELLRAAVRLAPDYSLARWQLGQVQVDGDWLAVEEAQRRAAANPRQGEYRELRKAHGESPQGQRALARWCRKYNLDQESRFHWASVLSVNPNNKEALRALEMRWYDGQLMSRSGVMQAKTESSGARRAARRWSISVTNWERALTKKDDPARTEALDEIRAVAELEAIPAFERVTLDSNEQSGKARKQARSEMSLAFLEALDAMVDHAATESLVRHAVLSQFPAARQQAIERLRYRPLHDVVPLLLDGLAARIDSSFRVIVEDDGSVHYLHSMYREGPFADLSHQASRSIYQQASPERIAARLSADQSLLTAQAETDSRVAAVSAVAANRSATQYEQEAAMAEQQVAQTNEATAARNERIVAVLTGVTDQSLGDEPRAWWDWWQDYNGYDQPEERPVYATEDVSSEYIIPTATHECFARGTLVWTKTGRQPIESLELGDLVLAQDVNTGELTYKPVIGRTVRPPTQILKLSFGGETLRTTRGHPLWVAGVGWRMTKELGDGAMLHGVTGAARVDAVTTDGEEEAYNLVVADFNTYFVGESGVLVHDNTPRRPTRATVPGLAAK